jgi:DNA excision repair protein ERCC-6
VRFWLAKIRLFYFILSRAAQSQLDLLKSKLKQSLDKEKILPKITQQAKRLHDATRDQKDILHRIKERERERYKANAPIDMNVRQDNETQRDFLVRTGKITPFDHLPEYHVKKHDTEATANTVFPGTGHDMSHTNLYAPSHYAAESSSTSLKRKLEDDEYIEDDQDQDEPSVDDLILDDDDDELVLKKPVIQKLDEIYEDDGSEANYQKRLNDWIHNRRIMRYRATHVIAVFEMGETSYEH